MLELLKNNVFFDVNDSFFDIIKEHLFCVGKHIKINPASHGKSSFVFFVTVHNEEYVYKFPRTSFSTFTVNKERFITNSLRSHLFCQIPNITIENHNGRPFVVYKSIKGSNMSDVTFNEAEMISLAKELAEFLIDFHSIPPESISYDIGTKRDSLDKFCRDFDYAPKFAEIENILKEKTLIHGDFHRSNIILDKNKKLKGVLDFATVSVGSKYFDIGHMIFSMTHRFNEIFLDEYEKISKCKIDTDKIKLVVSFLDDMINSNYLPFVRRAHDV